MKEIYDLRKETIERIFGTAKEYHGFRYTQYIGKARMNMKAGLTFACMNLKKLAKIMEIRKEKNILLSIFGDFCHLYPKISSEKKSVAGASAPATTLSTLWGHINFDMPLSISLICQGNSLSCLLYPIDTHVS